MTERKTNVICDNPNSVSFVFLKVALKLSRGGRRINMPIMKLCKSHLTTETRAFSEDLAYRDFFVITKISLFCLVMMLPIYFIVREAIP